MAGRPKPTYHCPSFMPPLFITGSAEVVYILCPSIPVGKQAPGPLKFGVVQAPWCGPPYNMSLLRKLVVLVVAPE
ncbi:hypothetical protein FLPS103535_12575 [Flavobacterium psychrophilum]